MLRDYFLKITENALENLIKSGSLGQMKQGDNYCLVVEQPKNTDFGDFAINVSSLSRHTKLAPPKTAQIIADSIDKDDFEINVLQGFINFKVGKKLLEETVFEVLEKGPDFAKNEKGKGVKVNLEYVSANPTGPFHIGHGRWAAVGSSLANLMKFSGYDVSQEFYINDAGSQIKNLANSLLIRIKQELGENVQFPDGEEAKNYYAGEYLIPVAKKYVEQNGKNVGSIDELADFAKEYMIKVQKELLSKLNVNFDVFFKETGLHTCGAVQESIDELKKRGFAYEKDGALWFRTTDFGDDQDRVLKKANGSFTYLAPDIAYHKNKLERGFSELINIWGADHHGYVNRMKASLSALGYNSEQLTVLLGQLVNIVVNGQVERMGKRKKMVTLDELVEEVGVDAVRFWMCMRSIDTTLDFDIELAKSKSDENPVFYVQYAHARASSVLRNAVLNRIDTVEKIEKEPLLSEIELEQAFKANNLQQLWGISDQEDNAAKKLILKLDEFKSVIDISLKNKAPYMLCRYASEAAGEFHRFYSVCRVLNEDKELAKARLCLVKSLKTVLKNVLTLIGVSSPERM